MPPERLQVRLGFRQPFLQLQNGQLRQQLRQLMATGKDAPARLPTDARPPPPPPPPMLATVQPQL